MSAKVIMIQQRLKIVREITRVMSSNEPEPTTPWPDQCQSKWLRHRRVNEAEK